MPGSDDNDLIIEEEAAAEAERAPLLPPKSSSPSSSSSSSRQKQKLHRSGFSITSVASSIATGITHVPIPKAQKDGGNSLTNILCAIVFLVSSSAGFVELPLTRLIEDILCHQYYGIVEEGQGVGQGLKLIVNQTQIDESMCKEDAIQKKLAYLLAINAMLFAVVGCVSAFPWGLAADKIGRKPIVALAMTGLLMSALIEMAVVYWHNTFPLTGIWLSSTGQFIGGGNAMLIAVIFAMVTDATKEEDRAMAFLRTHMASLCGNLLSPSLSAIVMEQTGNLWIAPIIGLSLFSLGGIIFVFLPETMVRKNPDQSESDSLDDDPALTATTSSAGSLRRIIAQFLRQLEEYINIVKSPSLILLLLTLLFSMPALFSTLNFLNQFVSRRYHIKIAQTGYVQTVYGIASLITSLLLLPWLSKYLLLHPSPSSPSSSSSPSSTTTNSKNWRFSFFTDEHARDLHLARYSFAILFLGALILFASPALSGFVFGLVLMAFGSGSSSLVKSLMSVYVDPEHRSRFFSLAGIVEVLGSVYAQPMLAGLFSLGLKLSGGGGGGGGGNGGGGGEGFWIGLPYLGVAVLVALAGLLLLFVRIPQHKDAGVGGPEAVVGEDGA